MNDGRSTEYHKMLLVSISWGCYMYITGTTGTCIVMAGTTYRRYQCNALTTRGRCGGGGGVSIYHGVSSIRPRAIKLKGLIGFCVCKIWVPYIMKG